ncbi:MAG TPA: ATP-binding cassette domain-containing protein [Bacilli bacterium]|nr:ATP-binding cassette domain-containing protein [Bacilli bacterium]
MIKIKNLTKSFSVNEETIMALDHVNLDIQKGEVYGIIGLSGAGKSTLLRCLSTLEQPDSGSVEIEAKDIFKLSGNDLRKFRSNIGVVFQGYHLLMQRNAYDNISFPLKIRKEPKEKIAARVNELFQFVGLQGKERVYPSKLSGGQRQRVAIARALATNPSLLLFDEPTSALDAVTTKQILKLIKEINEHYHVTIIIITHEIGVIKNVCDKVAVLNYGKVVEEGTVEEVLNNPQSDITKMLLGKELII